jgi:hypothetical protein
MKLIFVACQIIFNGTKSNFKKSCNLLFKQYNFAIKFNTLQSDALLNFCNRKGVVEDVLPVNCRDCQIFCHESAPLYRFKENLVVLFLLHVVSVEGLHCIGFEVNYPTHFELPGQAGLRK